MADVTRDLFELKYSQTFSMSGMEEADITLKLDPPSTVSTTVYGTVTDGVNPIPNATVKLFDDKGVPFQHTLTDAQGNYIMYNMPEGTYTIGAVHAGYRLSETVGLTVQNDDSREINLVCTADPTLSMGAIAGVVVVSKDGVETPLGNAKITLKDELDQTISITYTADDGEFAFYDVPDGVYTLISTAEGYLPAAPVTTSIEKGSISNMMISMDVDSRAYTGTVSGIIRDSFRAPIAGCFVGLYKAATETSREVLIATTKTNSSGKYLFGNVGAGDYIVKAKMNR